MVEMQDILKQQSKPKTEAAEKPAQPQAEGATEEASKKERKKKAREMTPEDVDFVVENIKTKSYTEIAEERGLTRHQVNRVLMDIKKDLRSQYPEGTPEREKIEEYIKSKLTRPEETRPGAGGGKKSGVKNALKSRSTSILDQLNLKKPE